MNEKLNGKTETKRKPLSIEKPINSPVIREISPECTSGLLRERLRKKKNVFRHE